MTIPTIPRSKIALIVGLLVLLLLASLTLFRPHIRDGAVDLTPTIDHGFQVWQQYGIRSYHIVVREQTVYGLGGEDENGYVIYDIVVRDDQITQHSCQQSYQKVNKCDWWHFWPGDYTVPGMFDRARDFTRHGVFFGKITSDIKYGFPALITNGIYDALWELRVEHFEELPEAAAERVAHQPTPLVARDRGVFKRS